MNSNVTVVSGPENLTVPRPPDLVIAPGDPTPPAGTYRHIVILPGAEIKPVGIIRTTDGLRILSQASDIAGELLAMLRKHEWAADVSDTPGWSPINGCPECRGLRHGGHAPDCALAALLARTDG